MRSTNKGKNSQKKKRLVGDSYKRKYPYENIILFSFFDKTIGLFVTKIMLQMTINKL